MSSVIRESGGKGVVQYAMCQLGERKTNKRQSQKQRQRQNRYKKQRQRQMQQHRQRHSSKSLEKVGLRLKGLVQSANEPGGQGQSSTI